MNLTPIELYFFLILPLSACFWKWQVSSKWISTTGICAVISWFYFNLWMTKLDPPDNGFANAVYLVTGWFWLLPIFGVFYIIFRLVERCLVIERRPKIGSAGFMFCAVFSGVVVAC